MTTSTTDAEAIARIIEDRPFEEDYQKGSAGAFSARGRKEAALRKAECILSYLASRREAQEPVAWRVTYADGGTVYLHHKPTGDSGVYECTPLYTATPAPAGEVERLVKPIIDRLEWNGRLQQWVVRPDLPAGTINAVRVALNGGREKGK